jgi:hypothetical protein
MAGLAFIGIAIMLGLLAASLACFIGLIVLWWKALAKPTGSGEPSCGRCGYVARGSSTLNCPECGADYRQVGIVSPKQKRGVPVWLFLLLWTVLLPLPSCIGSGLLLTVGPKESTTQVSISLKPNSLNAPGNTPGNASGSGTSAGGTSGGGTYDSVDLNNMVFRGNVSTWQMFFGGVPASADWLDVTVYSSNVGPGIPSYANMEIDTKAMMYDPMMSSLPTVTTTPSGMQPFDEQAALLLLSQVGVNTADAQVINEARELVAMVRQYPTAGVPTSGYQHFSVTSNHSWNNNMPAGWWVLVSWLLWPMLWVAGIVLFLLVRMRQDRKAEAKQRA